MEIEIEIEINTAAYLLPQTMHISFIEKDLQKI